MLSSSRKNYALLVLVFGTVHYLIHLIFILWKASTFWIAIYWVVSGFLMSIFAITTPCKMISYVFMLKDASLPKIILPLWFNYNFCIPSSLTTCIFISPFFNTWAFFICVWVMFCRLSWSSTNLLISFKILTYIANAELELLILTMTSWFVLEEEVLWVRWVGDDVTIYSKEVYNDSFKFDPFFVGIFLKITNWFFKVFVW